MAEGTMNSIEWATPPAERIRERDTRVAVMERCAFAISQLIGEHIVAVHEGVALVLNVSSGGMLLLMSHAPEFGQHLTIGLPRGVATDDGVRLADVRWIRAVGPSGRRMKYLTGVRFLEPQNLHGDEARLPTKKGRT
jgi:hypothetical protein